MRTAARIGETGKLIPFFLRNLKNILRNPPLKTASLDPFPQMVMAGNSIFETGYAKV